MHIRITLSNSGGEIARAVVKVQEDQDEQSHDIAEAIAAWVLSPGDTIKIEGIE